MILRALYNYFRARWRPAFNNQCYVTRFGVRVLRRPCPRPPLCFYCWQTVINCRDICIRRGRHLRCLPSGCLRRRLNEDNLRLLQCFPKFSNDPRESLPSRSDYSTLNAFGRYSVRSVLIVYMISASSEISAGTRVLSGGRNISLNPGGECR